MANQSPETLYHFIVNDFEDAWNSLASNPDAKGRGNFMFAKQAMTLLEFAARLCSLETSSTALKGLSDALYAIEPKYFTKLPGKCWDYSEFDLPYHTTKSDELLWALFDMIRNGQAHQYQQILIELLDGKTWQVALSGAALNSHLSHVPFTANLPHLTYRIESDGHIWIVIMPQMLFLNFKSAIEKSGLLSKGLVFPYLARPRKSYNKLNTIKGPFYQFGSDDLADSLRKGGHTQTVLSG